MGWTFIASDIFYILSYICLLKHLLHFLQLRNQSEPTESQLNNKINTSSVTSFHHIIEND